VREKQMDFAKVLSDEQAARIQDAAENVLDTVGFRVMHEGLMAKARAAGARVDQTAGLIRMPRPLLRELLAQVPAQFTIAWEKGHSVTIGNGDRHCNAIVTDPWIVDYATQQPRRPCIEDVRRHSIIAQQLDRVVTTGRMDYPVTDFDDATSSLRALEKHLLHYAKHYSVYVTSVESLDQWLDIVRIVAAGKGLELADLMSVAVAILSPLTLTEMNGELLLRCCEHHVPVVPTICPMAGTTSPYSHASTLVQGHAENMLLAALTQLVRPGNPFLYAYGPSVTDMRTGRDLYYTLDKVLWKNAATQLGRTLDLPTAAECGGSLTYRYDQQNGAEGMLFMLAAYSSGANLLCGIGSCHNAVGMSAEMMIIQTEWLKAAEFLSKGIVCDDRHIALRSLEQAGPGGHFLADDLTLELMHAGEFFASDVFDLNGGYEPGPPMLERAHEKAEALVADHQCPLPGTVREELERFFDKQYRKLQ